MIKFVTRTILFILFFFTTVPGIFAQEQGQPAPTPKEVFLAAWEENQKNLPTTVIFEKTAEPGVYNYETTVFPYKGKLKVLNIVISKDLDYYNYDLDLDDALIGLAEVELLDVDKDFRDRIYYSYNLWNEQNFLFSKAEGGEWLSDAQWEENHQDSAQNSSACAAPSPSAKYKKLLSDLLPIFIFLLIIIPLILWSRRLQKRQIAKYDLSMERQKESIEEQKRGLEIAEQSLALEKKQIELLQKLTEKK
ncbi:MAG: hypothetical protein H6861_00195 [Rhodospirillales bacterium]|nr:hypothetical protein [Rhodospirillales bacterium]